MKGSGARVLSCLQFNNKSSGLISFWPLHLHRKKHRNSSPSSKYLTVVGKFSDDYLNSGRQPHHRDRQDLIYTPTATLVSEGQRRTTMCIISLQRNLPHAGVWVHIRQGCSTCSFAGRRFISLSHCFSTLVSENAICSHFSFRRLVLRLFCCLNLLPFVFSNTL